MMRRVDTTAVSPTLTFALSRCGVVDFAAHGASSALGVATAARSMSTEQSVGSAASADHSSGSESDGFDAVELAAAIQASMGSEADTTMRRTESDLQQPRASLESIASDAARSGRMVGDELLLHQGIAASEADSHVHAQSSASAALPAASPSESDMWSGGNSSYEETIAILKKDLEWYKAQHTRAVDLMQRLHSDVKVLQAEVQQLRLAQAQAHAPPAADAAAVCSADQMD